MLRSAATPCPRKMARRMNENQLDNSQRIPIAAGSGNTPSPFTRHPKLLIPMRIRLF